MQNRRLQGNRRLALKRAAALAALCAFSLTPLVARATLIVSGSTSPSAATLNGGTGTTTSQVFIGVGAAGALTLNGSSAGNGITTFNASSASGAGITAGFSGTGNITVDGTDGAATLNSIRSMQIGGASGTGSLAVQNGGIAQTTGTNFEITVGSSGATGTVDVSGSGSAVRSAGRINVGAFDNASGTVTISGGGAMQTTGTNLASTEIVIGAGSNASGSVTVSGAGSTLSTGGMIIGDAVSGSSGSLTIQDGGTANSNQVAPGVGGVVSIGGGTNGSVTVTGAGSTLNVDPVSSGIFAGKELLVGGFANGSLLVDQSGLVDAAGANVIVSGGVLGTSVGSAGQLTVRDGGKLIADTVAVNPNGTLNGNGTVDADVQLNGGTIAPGTSPGTMTILGDLELLVGVLELEVDAALADLFNVTGNLVFGPDLTIRLVFLSAPAAGSSFDILDFFDVSGNTLIDPSFSLASNLTTLGLEGNQIVVSLQDQRVVAGGASVPEPSSIALLLLALCGLRALSLRSPHRADPLGGWFVGAHRLRGIAALRSA